MKGVFQLNHRQPRPSCSTCRAMPVDELVMIINRHSELARQIDAGWTDCSLACWPAGLLGACEEGAAHSTQ